MPLPVLAAKNVVQRQLQKEPLTKTTTLQRGFSHLYRASCYYQSFLLPTVLLKEY